MPTHKASNDQEILVPLAVRTILEQAIHFNTAADA
jgi:hypothetical protein